MSLDPDLSETPPPAPTSQSSAPGSESPHALRLRLMVMRDSMIKAAEQVNLLVDMGLGHTAGCRDARLNYETRAQEYHSLMSRLASQASKGV